MGKVIKLADHYIKADDETVGQRDVRRAYLKWKGVQWRRWIAAQKEEAENKKPRLVSPK